MYKIEQTNGIHGILYIINHAEDETLFNFFIFI